MPTRAGLNAIHGARSSVVERARRYRPPARRGRDDGATGKEPGPAKGRRSSSSARTTGVVLRRVAPGSVLKVSALFSLSLGLVLLVAGVLLWSAAHSVGLISNLESFMGDIGFTDFRLEGGQVMKAWLIVGGVLVVGGTLAGVLMAMLYNLLADVVGGVRLLLQEDETQSPRA
ncbi:MAG TPA: DUF3566 domain-containing protein [Acidimicrobiales bacterium]|nr:DUF3566 domain-containing protein [Acidimicrobiales bacterium]